MLPELQTESFGLMFKNVLIALVILTHMCASTLALPFMSEEGPVFIVEIQSRPFSIPTDWNNPSNAIKMEVVTEDYAVFIWNKAGKNIVRIFEGSDLGALMEVYRSNVFTRMSKSLLKLEIGKNKIKNGRVIEVQ